MTRRLGLATNIDPYNMWDKRSLRQVLDLAQSYNDLNNPEQEQTTDNTNSPLPNESERRGKGKHRNAVVPDWYVMPKGAKILDIDKMTRNEL
jgi:hypothetical protein